MSQSGSKPNDWASKQAAIDAASKEIIDRERSEREAKTARLKALREATIVSEPQASAIPRRAANKLKPRRVRARG